MSNKITMENSLGQLINFDKTIVKFVVVLETRMFTTSICDDSNIHENLDFDKDFEFQRNNTIL